jgi:tripartite-type tricarboxylate transporter receptor subunit TctC
MLIKRTISSQNKQETKMKIGAKILVFAMASMAALSVRAQTYPERPIRLIVPYAVGGGTDGTARIVSAKLTSLLGQSVIVENRPGAGGIIGEEVVAKSPADGYTLLFDAAPFVVNPSLRKLSFDAKKDLAPVSQVMTAPNILVVPANSPFKTFNDFLTYARANPGKLTFASAGIGTGQHLSGELLEAQAKIKMVHVPFSGGGPALVSLLAGQVSCYFANAASATRYVQSGQLRALAVTSEQRSSNLPNVPTIKELGFPNYSVTEWGGMFAPAGTPVAIVNKLAAAVQGAVKDPDVRSKISALGVFPLGSTPVQFSTFVDEEMTRWSALVKANNITLQ